MRLTTHSPTALLFTSFSLLTGACVPGMDAECSGRSTSRAGSGSADKCEPDPKPATNCAAEGAEVKVIKAAMTIRSDADFAALVPAGCWDLYAKLSITGTSVTSLQKLGSLMGVDELEIVGTSLTSLDTKQPLTVYGAVKIENNAKLTNLKNVEFVDADADPAQAGTYGLKTAYSITNNALLTTLDGLESIEEVEVDLKIAKNPALAGATFGSLATIGGNVTIESNGVKTLDVGELAYVGGTFLVTDNGAAATIDVSKLDKVVGTTVTFSKNGVTNLDLGKLGASTLLKPTLEISDNAQLTALRTPATLGNVTLRNNAQFRTFAAPSTLTSIGNLTIDNNAVLGSLDLFAPEATVGGSVTITNNGALASLGQLAHASNIGGTVNISTNVQLSVCEASQIDGCAPSGTVSWSGLKAAPNGCTCWCSNTTRHQQH